MDPVGRYLNNITYRELFVSKYTLHGESGEDGSNGSSESFSKLYGLEDRLLCSFIEDIIFHSSSLHQTANLLMIKILIRIVYENNNKNLIKTNNNNKINNV